MRSIRVDPEEVKTRFWGKYIPVTESGCWIWDSFCRRGGYGQFGIRNGVMVYAHRMAYWLAFGEFDESLDVLHRCDVPVCVNPNHLWLGTHKENMHDMISKGRGVF